MTIYSLDVILSLFGTSLLFMSSSKCCFLTCIQIFQKAGQVLWIPEVIDISPGNLEPACASSSLAFHMMYSAYKLNKQGDDIQPWCTPFPIWNKSIVPCLFITVTSWPAYRFLRREVRWPGIPISWRIFQFVVIHTVQGFGIFNKAQVDASLELSLIQ